MIFVDTNVFTRFFAKDDEKQRKIAKKLFEQAKNGELDLITGPPVLFELSWVLSYTYKIKNEVILDILEAILSFPGLRITDKLLVSEAIDLARQRKGSFADSYIVVSSRKLEVQEIVTFNLKHFKKLGASPFNFDA
jgi:predicted nucleic-acid-binding protein